MDVKMDAILKVQFALWINHFQNHIQAATRSIHWTFPQEQTHPLIETSSRDSYNSPKFGLDNFFYL